MLQLANECHLCTQICVQINIMVYLSDDLRSFLKPDFVSKDSTSSNNAEKAKL